MLVYRSDEEPLDVAPAWRGLLRRIDALPVAPPRDAITALLIESGEIEAAIADALCPDVDAVDATAALVREVTFGAARLFVASWQGVDTAEPAASLRRAAGAVPIDRLPAGAVRRVSEGYAYYALHPEGYAAAADRFAAATPVRQAVCLGLRSIGTGLAAVVAASLAARGVAVRLWSVRPRGHPFDRRLALDGSLRGQLASHSATAHYLVIDEGPGLSGSSFAAAVRAVAELGVPHDRIALFPSWDADGSTFRSEGARQAWERCRRFAAVNEEAGTGILAAIGDAASVDWSAGRWRRTVYGSEPWPAAWPQHERVKRWLPAARQIVRFAGLGAYGDARYARARTLAEHGPVQEPLWLRSGYLASSWTEGAPYRPFEADSRLLELVPGYCALLADRCVTSRPSPIDRLHHMVAVNCSEADPSMVVPPLSGFDAALRDTPAVQVDGRMLPHEFLRTADGVVKVDALDHGADHFFPGPVDICWDLAATEAEFSLDRGTASALVDAFARRARDPAAARRMPFYRLAYAAFQLGYATLACEAAPPDERQRFERRRAAFLARVRALTAR